MTRNRQSVVKDHMTVTQLAPGKLYARRFRGSQSPFTLMIATASRESDRTALGLLITTLPGDRWDLVWWNIESDGWVEVKTS